MDENQSVFLFVYGTLKKNDCRSSVLEGGRFIGNASTSKDYTLFDVGAFPAMVKVAEGDPDHYRQGVVGELYEVPLALLDDRLDAIEGVPYMYDRGTIPIASIDLAETGQDSDANVTEAIGYIWQQPTENLQHLGTRWNRR